MTNYPSMMLLCDFYKISHREQYPENTQKVYSTWTPRTSRIPGVDGVVVFGVQAFIKKYLINAFNENFFNRNKEEVVSEYRRVIKSTLGVENPDASHIEALHDLGYLPLEIKAVEEGLTVSTRTPMMTIINTDARFFWLTNYIETLASCELWQSATSATIAKQYRKILNKAALDTTGSTAGVEFQGHDFSMRGMSSLESAMSSGAGHLLSFVGTDTVPAIAYLEQYYGANVEKELVGTSIPATEHSVMCANGQNELAAYSRLIRDVYPSGFVSIVSDTWDLWKVLSDVIAPLKQDILNRNGKVVIRPDSGDPVKIICGDETGVSELERKGVVEALWDIFGGTVNEKGYKVLDTHIGCIYGDAITLERCQKICDKLKEKGFASTNMVYGIGSYTYQYNTRDTFGFALKSTLVVINGEEKQIFKNPKTDDGVKKSQKGKVVVQKINGVLSYKDELMLNSNETDLLRTVFLNGKLDNEQTLAQIRSNMV